MKRVSICITSVCILIIACTAVIFGQESAKGVSLKREYKAGQVWSYKTRPNEKASTLIVLKVDRDAKLGNIIHIALKELKIKRSGGGFLTAANHLPFAEKAIDLSVEKILSEDGELPDFEEGYNMWKEAFDAKKAGIYTISVAEAVRVMESTMNP